MAGFVTVVSVEFGGSSNGVGVYNGQNMQNAWDVNSPNVSGGGTTMGQYTIKNEAFIILNNTTGVSQPVVDSDLKGNAPQIEL
jgi:hypothetical protein